MALESKGFVASDDRIGKIRLPKKDTGDWLLLERYSGMVLSGPRTFSGSIPLATRPVWERLSQVTGETHFGLETVTWKPNLPEDAELPVFTIIFE
jgi:hypothetical protein